MRLGTITLQALDESDVFLKEDIQLDGFIDYNEFMCDIPRDAGFEQGIPYYSGKVPKPIPVNVDGDSSKIIGWFKSDNFIGSIKINIYLEYEEVEELVHEDESNKEQ